MIQCQITVPGFSDCLARTDKYKFPPGIAPPEMKQLSKSFEMLSNSGLRNPGLIKVNLELNMQT